MANDGLARADHGRRVTPTAIAYVDGFNFYYGAIKAHPEYKWLNLVGFCQALIPDHRLLRVRYYTSRITDWPSDPKQSQRQDVYLRALATLPDVEVVLGQFRTRPKKVRLRTGKTAWADVTEEKGSDVNLGADLVWDACHRESQCALVVSNDFDLQRPLNLAMTLGVEVLVANPYRHQSQRPAVHGSGTRNIRKHHLRDNQLARTLTDSGGRRITRPATW